MNAQEWLDKFSAELGVAAPTEDQFAELLELAGTAAHSSERIAAPVSCWMAATAMQRDGKSLEEIREIAEGLT